MNLFDQEFLLLQDFLYKLAPDLVLITSSTPLPSSHSLPELLYQQAKLYARKVLDLYETLDQKDEGGVFSSADLQTSLSPIKGGYCNRESLQLQCQRPEDYDLENKEEAMRHLAGCFSRKEGVSAGCRLLQTLDYEVTREIPLGRHIAWLAEANRAKDREIERVLAVLKGNREEIGFKEQDFFGLAREIEEMAGQIEEKGQFNGKIEYLNAEIERLNRDLEEKKENNRDKEALEVALRTEGEKRTALEGDLAELLEEFKLMKDKFEELAHENEKLKEQGEFSEKREDFERFNEALQEKEAKIAAFSQEKTDLLAKISEKEHFSAEFEATKTALVASTEKVEAFSAKIAALEAQLSEKNTQINSFNATILDWRSKYELIEQELEDPRLEGDSEQELATLKEQLLINERLLATREAEILDYCQTISRISDKIKGLEAENRRITLENNENRLKNAKMEKEMGFLNQELSVLREEKAVFAKKHDLIGQQEQKLVVLNGKFEDFRERSFAKIEALSSELQAISALKALLQQKLEEKASEASDLAEMNDSQARTLALKDGQIEGLEARIRLLEGEIEGLKRVAMEAGELRGKNQRCMETIKKSSSELDAAKKELEAVAMALKAAEGRVFEKEAAIIDLNSQVRTLKTEIERKNAFLAENKAFLAEKETFLAEKEAFLGENEEKNGFLAGKEEKTGNCKEIEVLREEVKALRREKDEIGKEYQRMIEKTMLDSQKLTVEMLSREEKEERFLEISNFQEKNEHFHLKNEPFPMKNEQFQVKNENFPVKNEAFQVKKEVFQVKKEAFPAKNEAFPQKKMLEERDFEIKRLSKIVKTLSNRCLDEPVWQVNRSGKR